jgi:hypothetical protein
MKKYLFTTQAQVRVAFWNSTAEFERIPGYSQNDYPATVRCAFVDFVDALARYGDISEALAQRVTL